MGFLSGSKKTYAKKSTPMTMPESAACRGDDDAPEECDPVPCDDGANVEQQLEQYAESMMGSAAEGEPDAALTMADVFLDAFARQFPDNFHPRWSHSLDNARGFCAFYLLAEHFGADENELKKRMLKFLSHFGDREDIEYFESEIYVPLKIQMLAHLSEE